MLYGKFSVDDYSEQGGVERGGVSLVISGGGKSKRGDGMTKRWCRV